MNYNKPKSFWLTVILTVILSSIGFTLLHFHLAGYGYTFFLLVPVCIGYFLNEEPSWRTSSIFAVIVGLVAFFYLLITAQLEGMFCVVTLTPFIVVLIIIGMYIGGAIRKVFTPDNNRLSLNLYPILLIVATTTIEHYFVETYDYNKLESQIYLPYKPEKVFDYIKSVDTLDTQKPLLLHLGLSVPQKCILMGDSIGADRICYFKEGTINEKVVEYRRGEILKMEVTRYNLPGRKWLKFIEATYIFKPYKGGTILTRITSYRTELKPRFYWSFWEEQAIEAEHEYVLNDLRQRLATGL